MPIVLLVSVVWVAGFMALRKNFAPRV